jgi:hypothetical protein
MKTNERKIAFISFSESGLFNELRPIQIKKFLSAISGCARLSESTFRISHCSAPKAWALISQPE